MHDGGKILGALAAFVAVALVPFWRPLVGGSAPRPEPKIVTAEPRCVRPRAEMRQSHMELLVSWREAVVRRSQRVETVPGGTPVTMSLSGTCMRCHPNKAEFCDACHNALAVAPTCWQCHLEPKEKA